MIKPLTRITLLVLSTCLLNACGAGSGSSGAPPGQGSLQNGRFVDNPVEGLEFSTSTQQGLSNRQGQFQYREGETLRLHIGDVTLGEALAAAAMTPLDFAPNGDINHPIATNIARTLITLDADCDVASGIRISAQARQAGIGRTGADTINFNQSPAAFTDDPAVQSFIGAAKGACPELISAQQAREHLQATLDFMAANNGQPNFLPTAVAGPDRTVNANTPVTLDGNASSDPEDGANLAFAWLQIAGPSVDLSDADAASTSFTSPTVTEDTKLAFRLTVTDSAGATHSDEVTVTVRGEAQPNQPPVANAGANQIVNEGATVTLDGSASSDPEDGSNLDFVWTQTAGPAVALNDADTATPSFIAPAVDADTVLSFQLVVTDSEGLSSEPDSVNITVKNIDPGTEPPVADAGPDRDVSEGTDVVLDGSGSSDPQGLALSFAWEQLSGQPEVTLDGADTDTARFTAPDVAGDQVLTFRLTVTNSDNAVDSDTVQVTIRDNTVVSINDASVVEGDEGTTPMEFTVTLSAQQPTVVTMDFATRDGTATSTGDNPDYQAASGTLHFEPGETEQSITVNVLGNTLPQDDRRFFLTLSNIQNAGIDRTEAIGTIIDDDAGPLFVGAAKERITPTEQHIEGIDEDRLGGTTHTQKFNLGGFGLDPTQNFPDPVGGFGDMLTSPANAQVYENSHAHEEHTWIRAMVVSERQADGSDKQVAFVILDAVGAGNVISNNLKAAVSAATGIAPNDIIFGQTHSHAGADLQGLWGGVPQDWIDSILYPAAVTAVREAQRNSCRAELTVAQGEERRYNRYRRGDTGLDVEADPHLTLLQARCANGGEGEELKASLLQYNAHPVGIGDGVDPRVPHADYILGAVEWLEAEGGVALYYNGPIAEASTSGSRPGCSFPDDGSFGTVRCRGEAMAESGLNFEPRLLDPTLESRHETVVLPVTNPAFLAAGALGSFNRYYDFLMLPTADIPFLGPEFQYLPQVTPTAETPVSRITIGGPGGLEIVTIPGEATNTFGQYIRSLAAQSNPNAEVMLLGLTQQSFGYIIPENEFLVGEVLVLNDPYEEIVSLGPLTAPLLRLQGYNPLFDVAPDSPDNLPPWLSACENTDDSSCIINEIGRRLSHIQGMYEDTCLDAGLPGQFCALFNPGASVAQACHDAGLPDGLCNVFGPPADGDDDDSGNPDQALGIPAAAALIQGCDILDNSNCLLPFPSDHFTAPAAADSPQSAERGGTGRRINFNTLAMPRNTAGKPIDPTEWNRNDGYSPGQMIITYVPGIATVKDDEGKPIGPIVGAPPITDIGQSLDIANASVLVLDAETGEPHPVWAEINLNAGFLLPADQMENPSPLDETRPSLIIRPAVNFKEGRRYVVVLKNLQSEAGGIIPAGPAFRVCRDGLDSQLPPVQDRCDALGQNVFPTLVNAGIDVENNESLYLAWDFTVASTENNVGRLRHMRDDAFLDYLGQQEAEDGSIINLGRAPGFSVTEVIDNPSGGIARTVKGSFTVPSYVVPVDPSPLDGNNLLNELGEALPEPLGGLLGQIPSELTTVSAPPNRLFYNPADGSPGFDPNNPLDPFNTRYGDGLPDRSGEMTATFTCNIPESATPAKPARPSLYGHGLLGGQGEVGAGNVRAMSNDHNMMFCAIDWFGFAFGDVPNVVTVLFDLSNFPVIPDGSQQGMLNKLFMARLLHHPDGLVAHEAFQQDDIPLFDNREVFYDGNSQGGILAAPVVALSKDIRRAVLGVVGMNYSTLLRRSVDFDSALEPGIPPYALPLYLSYQDDLDRDLAFSLIQMLWDRSENNGYAHHLTDNSALGGPDNQVLLHPAFADHQVTHWSAHVMARTVGVEVADMYARKPGEGEPFEFADKFDFFEQRDPDESVFWGMPLVGRDAEAAYDTLCQGNSCRSSKSALIQFDQGRTAIPPIGNVPPTADSFDPHGYPRATAFGQCQKSHFLHTQGRIIDVRDTRNVTGPANCPELPEPVGTVLPGDSETGDNDDLIGAITNCLSNADVIGCIDSLPQTLATAVDTLAQACQDNAGDADAACALLDPLGDLLAAEQPNGPVDGIQNASCATDTELTGGRSYQVKLPGHDGVVVSFQVLEPTNFDCNNINLGAHPLMLHGPGYSGSRSTSGFDSYRNNGYTVISWDPRGFGDAGGTVRVMDPEFEGQYLVQILDWAEQNLDYLSWRDEASGEFVARPADASSVPGGVNLVVGAQGGSYGGGYQLLLLAVDPKKRLDAIAPDITWHDLRNALNPGDVIKTLWDVALTAAGEGVGHSSGGLPHDDGQDPFIKETLARGASTNVWPRQSLDWFHYRGLGYWCAAAGLPAMRYPAYSAEADTPAMLDITDSYNVPNAQADGRPGFGNFLQAPADAATHFQGLEVLITQGMPDTLFNFNEAWWNQQCLSAAGATVSLYTHSSGHTLPVQSPDSTNEPAGSCDYTTQHWFDARLTPDGNPADLDEMCFVLGENDTVTMAAADVLAPQHTADDPDDRSRFTVRDITADAVPNGFAALANTSGNVPVSVSLGVVGEAGGVLAGIAHLDVTVATLSGINESVQDCSALNAHTQPGCDSITFVGLGIRRAGMLSLPTFELIDDQLQPLRGLGEHQVDLVGIAERLLPGDELALLLYGAHTQFFSSFSRDITIPAVTVNGSVYLPIYAVDAEGSPEPAANASAVLSDPAAGGDGPQPAACRPDNDDWQSYAILKGSLHQHSGYSDGEVGTSPADYFAAGRNLGMDFMGSSEHSDNAMLPITANQDCLSEQIFECFQAPPEGVLKWNDTQTLADAATTDSYTAFRGFEWTSDRFGHINVFFSQNDLNAKTSTGYALSMEDFWLWFSAPAAIGGGDDGLAVFNHPGREDDIHTTSPVGDPAYAWNNMAYRADADARMVGIEVYGKSNHVYDEDNNAPPGGWYAHALDLGWHVGPIGAEDEHGTAWAQPERAKTILIAADRSRAALKEAMHARRFFAVAHHHNSLRLSFTADNQPMGSVHGVPAGSTLVFNADLIQHSTINDPFIEIVGPGGNVVTSAQDTRLTFSIDVFNINEQWRYMRVRDGADGPIVAYSAPIWFRASEEPYPLCPPDPNPPAPPQSPPEDDVADGAGLASCLLNGDPALCQQAIVGLPQALAQCPPSEEGFNCAFNAAYDHIGVGTAAALLAELYAQCAASPAEPLCLAIRDSGGVPDRLPVAAEPVARGMLTVKDEYFAATSAKLPGEGLSQWIGESARIGGTAHYSAGEHIYSDYLFDAFGADDGDDARRLAVLLLLGELNSRTARVDQLFQAAGDQFGAPAPAGANDHYGSVTDREDGTDLIEVRWAADAVDLHLIARVARLIDEEKLVLLVLADTDDEKAGLDGLDHFGVDVSLRSQRFDRAALLRKSGGELIDTVSGEALATVATHVDATGYDNFLQAALPKELFERSDGTIRVAVMTLRANNDGSFTPANVAYRFDEPVAGLYNDRSQALSLFLGNIDHFVADIDLGKLRNGFTEEVRPGPGYHERRFASGDNISVENSTEEGRYQPYGLYVPTGYNPDSESASALTLWLHYRGGKAHSGAAWTPRLIHQLGEGVNNLVITPRGRGTSRWYVSHSHQDVFEVFADAAGLDITRATGLPAEQQYPGSERPGSNGGLLQVDAARVYLSGYSMGGYGTYLFGLLYPDLFAAGYSTSGAPTQGAWTGIGPDDPLCSTEPTDIPSVGEGNPCFVEANDGRANAQLNWRLLENARHLPLSIHHGSNDQLVPISGLQRFSERLFELGYRYDFLTFLGYEHFTQAIIDEWADGVVYMQQFTRPENPRKVSYKLVPAMLTAVREVRVPGNISEPDFSFIDPRGAYWIDDITLRDGDPADPNVFAQVDAESDRLAGEQVLAVPRSGISDDPLYLSTPLLSPGNHSTPFLRQGLDWLSIGEEDTALNRFRVTLTNAASASLDLPRMNLSFSERIDALVNSDGSAQLRLRAVGETMTACVNAQLIGTIVAGGDAVINISEGESLIVLLPGSGQECALAGDDSGPFAGERGITQVGDDFESHTETAVGELAGGDVQGALGTTQLAVNDLADGVSGLIVDNNNASVANLLEEGAEDPSTISDNLEQIIGGFTGSGPVRAGVGVVDMTWNVGACSGQHCELSNLPDGLSGGDIDPHLHHRAKSASHGVQSRLNARAIVVEGANGKRVALIKTDNYLAQDLLLRRVGQILALGDSGIGYEQILHAASHNHSSPYYSTLAWGVWIFQDVFDQRMFEFQARRIAEAIELAAADLRPARMGAHVVKHQAFKGNVVREAIADDGTPAGYPREFGDFDLTLVRFDAEVAPGTYQPLAAYMNFGMHPEGLQGYSMHTADFLGPLERFVDRELGVPLVFSQGDVGSAENSGNPDHLLDDNGNVCGNLNTGIDNCPEGEGVARRWYHEGFAHAERGARLLANDVIAAFEAVDTPAARMPFSNNFIVDWRAAWVPGPVSHPYPAVSNCRSEPTYSGDPGVPVLGLPDCHRETSTFETFQPVFDPAALVVENMKSHGVPVPDHYDAPSFTGVEENIRIYLQAFRLGEVLLASCACEAQVDLIMNLKTRIDNVPNNQYNGFDWACLIDEYKDDPAYTQACEIQRQYYDPRDADRFESHSPIVVRGDNFSPEAIAHMRAQVHNDARGWDLPENALHANSEPADIENIWGNFTHEELPPHLGYAVPVGIGHAGDYVGYTVSYREFMNRDHYRKALTAYGAHTADYMVTRLMKMAGAMKGGPELRPEPHDTLATTDELRQESLALFVGHTSAYAYDAWLSALPTDLGPIEPVAQPSDVTRFDAATFTWRGGSNAADNPDVVVEREVAPGEWEVFADMSGEVQTRVFFPQGIEGVADTFTGSQEWLWAANFEAFTAHPLSLGSTPEGRYRFVVNGRAKTNLQEEPAGAGVEQYPCEDILSGVLFTCYRVVSAPFQVDPWPGIIVQNPVVETESVRFEIAAINYPESYDSIFPFVNSGEADRVICRRCSFRPWARSGEVQSAWLQVTRADGTTDQADAEREGAVWRAPVSLQTGDTAVIHVRDTGGNTNSPINVSG